MKLKTDRKKDLSMIFAALIVALVYIICVIYIYQSLNVSETDSGESSRRQVAVIVNLRIPHSGRVYSPGPGRQQPNIISA